MKDYLKARQSDALTHTSWYKKYHMVIEVQGGGFDARTLTGPQLRAARALLGITAQELANASKLGVTTIRRAELEAGRVSMTAANAEHLVRTLERAGIEFIAANGGGPGVRLRKAQETA